MADGQRRTVRLARPLERAIAAGHPWLYREALADEPGPPGTITTVRDRRGRFMGRGFADDGPIGVRIVTTRDEPVDEALFADRIASALALRDSVIGPDTTAWRLLHGEGDRVPGVVCDVYGEHAVVRFDGAGAAALEPVVLAALLPALGDRAVLVREGRGETMTVRAARGAIPEAPIAVREHGMTLLADLARGQKTGLFLDHRESRRTVRSLARGRRVLNLYGYTGGFSVAAGLGGAARVETVDIAAPAIEMAAATWAANALDPDAHAGHVADAPEFLAEAREGAFDLVVADPPSFAPRKSAREGALESYEKLHTACLGLLAPSGLYLAASCSSHVTRADFDTTLREGASRAKRVVQILGAWGAPADHPRLAAFPEGDYLKVTLARVIG